MLGAVRSQRSTLIYFTGELTDRFAAVPRMQDASVAEANRLNRAHLHR